MFQKWRRNTQGQTINFRSESRNSRTFACWTASCAASTDPKASIPALATKVFVKRLAAVAGQAAQERLRMAHTTFKTIGNRVWFWHQLCGLSHEKPRGPVKPWFVCFAAVFMGHGLVGKPATATVYLCCQFSAHRHAKLGTHITISPPTVSSSVQHLRSSWSGFVSRGLPSLWHLP